MQYKKKEIALKLRKDGMSYSQIKNVISVSKSTLSLWLSSMPLSEERIYQLRRSDQKIEKYRATMRKKADARIKEQFKRVKKKLLPLSDREKFLMGLFLYWGEGKKGFKEAISVSNTDPEVIRFGYKWMTEYLMIPAEKIRVSVHLYGDMNKEKELNFWSSLLCIPLNQFYKPYIKQTNLADRKHAGFNHGTCNISACNVRLKEEVLVSISVVVREILDLRV